MIRENNQPFVIDPASEPATAGLPDVSPQQESDFYASAGQQYRLLHNQQNLGFLGRFFGANSSAPTNIAGFVIICALIILLISLFVPANADLVESRKWMVGLITSALSFVFGAATKK